MVVLLHWCMLQAKLIKELQQSYINDTADTSSKRNTNIGCSVPGRMTRSRAKMNPIAGGSDSVCDKKDKASPTFASEYLKIKWGRKVSQKEEKKISYSQINSEEKPLNEMTNSCLTHEAGILRENGVQLTEFKIKSLEKPKSSRWRRDCPEIHISPSNKTSDLPIDSQSELSILKTKHCTLKNKRAGYRNGSHQQLIEEKSTVSSDSPQRLNAEIIDVDVQVGSKEIYSSNISYKYDSTIHTDCTLTIPISIHAECTDETIVPRTQSGNYVH